VLRSRRAFVDEPDGPEITPLQIFEQDQDRVHGGLCAEEIDPRLAHLLAHELSVLPRGGERGAALAAAGERRADELTQELGHPLLLARRYALGDPPPDLGPAPRRAARPRE